MTKIEIICGTYGYRPDGSKHPIPIDRGGICEVSEEEAQRLFGGRPCVEPPDHGAVLLCIHKGILPVITFHH